MLAEAGYPQGFETELVGAALPQVLDPIQTYLGAVGIQARVVQMQAADAVRRETRADRGRRDSGAAKVWLGGSKAAVREVDDGSAGGDDGLAIEAVGSRGRSGERVRLRRKGGPAEADRGRPGRSSSSRGVRRRACEWPPDELDWRPDVGRAGEEGRSCCWRRAAGASRGS